MKGLPNMPVIWSIWLGVPLNRYITRLALAIITRYHEHAGKHYVG